MQIQTKEELEKLLLERSNILRNYGVDQIGVFGSLLHGDFNKKSDVDLLVDFKAGQKTFQNFMGLCFYLEDLIGKEVDLVTRAGLSPYIAPQITDEAYYIKIS